MAKSSQMLKATYLLVSVLILSVCCFGQSPQSDSGDALADALVKWDTKCGPKGCLLMTDVLRGYSGLPTPPDPKDFREYIGIYVAIDRATQKPAYFAFHVDPNASQSNGIFIAFSKTTRDGASWKLNPDPEGPTRLMFDSCSEKSCVVRVRKGLVEEGQDSNKMDLLDKFLSSDHIWILYLKDGQAYRTMLILSSFKKAYRNLLTSGMEPAK